MSYSTPFFDPTPRILLPFHFFLRFCCTKPNLSIPPSACSRLGAPINNVNGKSFQPRALDFPPPSLPSTTSSPQANSASHTAMRAADALPHHLHSNPSFNHYEQQQQQLYQQLLLASALMSQPFSPFLSSPAAHPRIPASLRLGPRSASRSNAEVKEEIL